MRRHITSPTLAGALVDGDSGGCQRSALGILQDDVDAVSAGLMEGASEDHLATQGHHGNVITLDALHLVAAGVRHDRAGRGGIAGQCKELWVFNGAGGEVKVNVFD